MGQGQSTTGDSDSVPQDTPPKKDYYDLLGVERTATEDEIKKAYRRKALELHPDRNYGNVEDATRLFAEIQSAYEVLSDPQERAWYDSHRDVLLRGDTVSGEQGEEFSYNVKMTTADEVMGLMMKFNGRLDFSDSPSGFHGGLDEFFKKLAKEEDVACQWEGEEPLDYPDFGSRDDDYEDVVRPFYAAWTSFVTRKSYAWKDQYRLSDAPDRRIRRLMERENRKLRDEAIQEYNDAVRVLVAFVRKRDPRVQNNKTSEAERQKALKDAANAQAARAKAARQAKLEELENYVIPDWAKSRTVDEHEGGFSSESEIEEHEYECVVCDKTFKSEAQYKAHEKSKKHVKLLKQLQREMKAEGKELNLEGKGEANGVELVDESDDIEGDQLEVEKDGAGLNDINSFGSQNKSDTEYDSKDESTTQKKEFTIPAPAEESKSDSNSESESADSDYAPRAQVEAHINDADPNSLASTLKSTKISSPDTGTSTPLSSELDPDNDTSTPQSQTSKLGKAKLKRAKKAAAAAGGSTTPSTNANGGATAGSVGGEFKCAICAADFSSKTKLFNHINEEGHAAPVSQVKGGKKAAGGGGGKKKK